MTSGRRIVAKKISDIHTEVQIAAGSVPLTVPKDLPTDRVTTVLMRCCGMTNLAAFGFFLKALQAGETAEITCYDPERVAREWDLQSIS